jgi:molybdenum cofactor cytidylyltransferase
MAGIGAVILAAGASTRMSIPKQLLQFRGQAFLRRAASVALEAGCQPVVVVTGANAAACRESLRGLDVLEVENPQWESGDEFIDTRRHRSTCHAESSNRRGRADVM